MSLRILCAALLAPALLTVPATAQDLRDYGFTDGWNIMIDPSMGPGCLIQKIVGKDSVVRLGYDATRDQGYVTVFDNRWGQIKDGAKYDVSFELDGRVFEATAIGFHLGKVPGAGFFFIDRRFVDEIAARRTMSIFGQNGKVLDIDLAGSANALKHARQCQAAQG